MYMYIHVDVFSPPICEQRVHVCVSLNYKIQMTNVNHIIAQK